MKRRASVIVATTLLAVVASAAWADEPTGAGAANQTAQQPAISSNTAFLTDYLANGQNLSFYSTTHGNLLGVEVAAAEEPLRAHIGLKEGEGVVVTSVPEDSEAAKVGLRRHDVVVRINEQPIASPEKFHELVSAQQGKKVEFHVIRGSKPTVLTVTLPNTPVYQFANPQVTYTGIAFGDNQYRIGVTLAPADDALRSQLRMAEGEGLVVTEVVADGPAAQAGLQKHDVMTKLDGKRLTTVEGANTLIQEIKDRKVAVTFFRGGKEASVELSPKLSASYQWQTHPMSGAVNVFHMQGTGIFTNRNQNFLQTYNATTLQPYVQWMDAVTGTTPLAAAQGAGDSATTQVAELKEQLKRMQQTIAALEATLQKEEQEKRQTQATSQPQNEKPQAESQQK
jgi:membrane-associated protease RseP (regulator of RpoE activity)